MPPAALYGTGSQAGTHSCTGRVRRTRGGGEKTYTSTQVKVTLPKVNVCEIPGEKQCLTSHFPHHLYYSGEAASKEMLHTGLRDRENSKTRQDPFLRSTSHTQIKYKNYKESQNPTETYSQKSGRLSITKAVPASPKLHSGRTHCHPT